MADDNQETELDLEPEQSVGDGAKSGKSKRKLFAIIGLLALVAAGAGGYYFFMGSTESEELAEEEVEEPIPAAFYLELDPVFIINLPDKGKQRFLQTSVTVMSRSQAAIRKFEQHMPVFRHHLNNVLSTQTISSIQSPGGIEDARVQALEQINRVLVEELGSEAIETVLFTSFVMQ